MALILTNVYLEDTQRKTLEKLAKKHKSNLSVEVRNAVDIYSTGISLEDLKILDETTRRAQKDIAEMNSILDGGLERAKDFFVQMEKIKEVTL